MSAPTREFSKLKIEERGMASSSRRSIAQQERRRREHVERQREYQALQTQQQQQLQPAAPTRAAPFHANQAPEIQGYSGIKYNASNMPPGAYATAMEALCSQKYMVDLAIHHRDPKGSYIAFQLRGTESIRVYPYEPTPEKQNLSCTCKDFERHKICRHVYWLYDGITDVLVPEAHSVVQNIDVISIGNSLYELSSEISQNISTLPDSINLRTMETNESEFGDDPEEMFMLQDMLSVLDTNKLPDEFDEEWMDSLPKTDKSYSSLIVPNDPAATLCCLARSDPLLRDRLRNAMPKHVCAADFLQKLEKRSKMIFQRFDSYASHGPDLKPAFVASCAQGLKNIITSIADYQKSRGPLSLDFASRSAKIAYDSLVEVVDRDRDIYASSPWLDSDEKAPSAPHERNLFTNLLRTAPGETQPGSGPTRGFFVLDLIDNLQITAWESLLEPMKRILRRLETTNIPRAYISKLRELSNTDPAAWSHMDPSRSTSRPPRSPAHSGTGDPSSSERASSVRRRPETLDPREPQRRRLD